MGHWKIGGFPESVMESDSSFRIISSKPKREVFAVLQMKQ